jgi:hypothetical protein
MSRFVAAWLRQPRQEVDDYPLRATGWGPFTIPGERKRLARAFDRAARIEELLGGQVEDAISEGGQTASTPQDASEAAREGSGFGPGVKEGTTRRKAQRVVRRSTLEPLSRTEREAAAAHPRARPWQTVSDSLATEGLNDLVGEIASLQRTASTLAIDLHKYVWARFREISKDEPVTADEVTARFNAYMSDLYEDRSGMAPDVDLPSVDVEGIGYYAGEFYDVRTKRKYTTGPAKGLESEPSASSEASADQARES